MVIVGRSERIYGVMDQLAQGIVVQKSQLAPPLQTAGQPGHISAGVAPVVSAQPFAAKGAFQIGGRIHIRLGTAQLECKAVAPGHDLQIISGQKLPKRFVTCPFDVGYTAFSK